MSVYKPINLEPTMVFACSPTIYQHAHLFFVTDVIINCKKVQFINTKFQHLGNKSSE